MIYIIDKKCGIEGLLMTTKPDWAKIDYDKSQLTMREWLLCIVEIVVISCIVNYLCYQEVYVFLLSIPFSIWYIGWKKKQKKEQRKKCLEHQFYDVLQALHTAIRTGYSMEQSVTECKKELLQIYGKENDFVKELSFMEKQMHLGVPVEQLFLDFGQRSGVEDIRYFGEIFLIARRSGGNLAQIIEKLANVLGEKSRVQKEIDVAIAGKRMEQGIMSIVPGGIILYMQITSDGFLDVLYHNIFGMAVMSVCLIIYTVSFWMGRKMIRISI